LGEALRRAACRARGIRGDDLAEVLGLVIVLGAYSRSVGGSSSIAASTAQFLEHNDVAGFIIAVVGTLYAVVLGFSRSVRSW